MKKFNGLAVCLLLLFHFGRAQHKISGVVTDEETRSPLIGATVVLKNSGKGIVTDTDGVFTLTIGKAGMAQLEISYVGYQTKELLLDVKQDHEIEIAMRSSVLLETVAIQGIRAGEDDPFSQKTIEKKDVESTYVGQDALFLLDQASPSIVAYSESGTGLSNYGQMRLRGIDQTRINITLNGIPLNDMIDQGVFFSNFTDFGNSIESVQIQRGVGSSTNGTASYAGSINFESVQLNDTAAAVDMQLMAGSFNTYRASLELKSGLLDEKLAFYSRFTKTSSDGYRFNTGTESYSFFFSGGYFAGDNMVRITGFTGRSQNGLAYLPVLIDDIRDEPRTNYLSPNDTDDFGQQFLQLQHVKWFSNSFSLNSSLYYGGSGGDFPSGFTNEDGEFAQTNFPLFNDHYGLMSVVNYDQAGGRIQASGGVHAYIFKRVNKESIIPDVTNPYYQDESQKNEISLFGKASVNFERLSLYGDLQFRHVTLELRPDEAFLGQEANVPQRNWAFFNPKIGLTYKLNYNVDFYASFGRTGREPTRFDILGAANINTFNLDAVEDEDAVQPEFVNDVEIGSRINSTTFSLQANFFWMDFKDEIAPIGAFIPEGFVQLRKNIEDSYRLGVELDWTWKPIEQLELFGGTTFMQSKIKSFSPQDEEEVFEDVDPILTPDWAGNLGVSYKPVTNLEIRFNSRYMSESFLELTNDPGLTLPSYFIVDSQISYQFLKRMGLTVQLNNLFDEQYFNFGAPVDTDFDGNINGPGYMVQPPRHVYAILKVSI